VTPSTHTPSGQSSMPIQQDCSTSRAFMITHASIIVAGTLLRQASLKSLWAVHAIPPGGLPEPPAGCSLPVLLMLLLA
jgi:hypothetical protein